MRVISIMQVLFCLLFDKDEDKLYFFYVKRLHYEKNQGDLFVRELMKYLSLFLNNKRCRQGVIVQPYIHPIVKNHLLSIFESRVCYHIFLWFVTSTYTFG